jgi:CheY-like chemotaxis protein
MRELNPDARLLIVDDSVANFSLLRNILHRLGFTQIDTITDARETLRRVEEFRPDLIILALNMPHLDEFGLMQQLSKFIPREHFSARARAHRGRDRRDETQSLVERRDGPGDEAFQLVGGLHADSRFTAHPLSSSPAPRAKSDA